MINEGQVITKITTRDEFGRFTAMASRAGEAMLEEMARDGAELSRELAPVGHKPDPRSVSVRDGIRYFTTHDTASWTSVARHAMAVELGSKRHPQSGNVGFFWEREGRRWGPGDNIIDHPATAAKPYLRPAWEIIMDRWDEYARKHFG